MDLTWLEVLCRDLDRARSLTVLLLVRHGEWEQLVNLRCYPSDYTSDDIQGFRSDHQITELLRKCTDLPLDYSSHKDDCISSFFASEATCRRTNQRLYSYKRYFDNDWFPGTTNPLWVKVIQRARHHCRRILRDIPDDFDLRWSSGSTFRDRRFITAMDKMSSRPTATHDAYQVVLPSWERTLWSRSLCSEQPHRSSPEIIRGNRFTTVPKDATKVRGICVEPSINVSHQLSVGKVIRKRLRSEGIDLKFGQAIHQRLVAEGSLSLDIGTIDLSNASDTVSHRLVELFLPKLWFELLDSLRSPSTFIDGNWVDLEKFSSMGNGFTFELETLLFYVICLAVNDVCGSKFDRSSFSVYGDDIIVPVTLADKVITTLSFFGFTPNKRKTFVSDVPFRESCGADYFNGVPCRGFYLDKINCKEPADWIALANGISRMVGPDLDRFNDWGLYLRCWLRVLSRIPANIRSCRGPRELGDACIYDPRWRDRAKRNRFGSYSLKGIRPCFGRSAFTTYERRCWTRGSIVSAFLLGNLRHFGDIPLGLSDRKAIRPNIQLARHEPIGFEFFKIDYLEGFSSPLSRHIDSVVGCS